MIRVRPCVGVLWQTDWTDMRILGEVDRVLQLQETVVIVILRVFSSSILWVVFYPCDIPATLV